MQSCLENRGIKARHEEIVRNDYGNNNEYSSTHKNAIGGEDSIGKGSPSIKGHNDWLPDCTKPTTMINYSNFDTENGGNMYDINGRNGIGGRKQSLVRSMYNKENQYGADLIETEENIKDGQIRF